MLYTQRLSIAAAFRAATAALALAACAATSNLDQAPAWKDLSGSALLLAEPELGAAYPPARYEIVVSVGTGATVAEARRAAEAEARAQLARQISSWVRNDFVSRRTVSSTTGSGSTRVVESTDIRDTITVTSEHLVAGVCLLRMWDEGFDGDLRYAYAVHALDKLVAARVARSLADRLGQALSTLDYAHLTPQTSLSGLQDLIRLEVVLTTLPFLGEATPELPVSSWRESFHTCLLQHTEESVSSGDQGRLEEALVLCKTAEDLDPAGGWAGRSTRIMQLLPCETCGRSGDCRACQASGGHHRTCSRCDGTKTAHVTCSSCGGSGQRDCARCRGCGQVDTVCPTEERCGQCGGAGGFQATCRTCGGCGLNPWNSYYCCPECGGCGSVPVYCGACRGTGRTACGLCWGRGSREVTCRSCGGTGREGACDRCKASGQVPVHCNACDDQGRQWVTCSTCRGSARCRTCNGQGHRV